jgi:acetoin utilization protein AcuB
MIRRQPTVADFMTPQPHTVRNDQSIAAARKRMAELGVRHLPVLHGGKLVGLVSERDLLLASGPGGVDPAHALVEDVAVERLHEVPPDALLRDVARTMAIERIGSAIVTRDGELLGVFTTVDACRALAHMLSET